MADFGAQVTNYVKNEAQNFVDKTVGNLVNDLSSIGGGVINSLIGSVANGLSQNLMDIGNAFNTIEAVVSQKMDSIVAGGDPEYAAGGKCADRASAADISSMRNPNSTSLKDHKLNTLPDTVIDKKYSEFTDSKMIVLTEQSSRYYARLRFYNYERDKLFKKNENSDLRYSVELPLPTELIDSQRSEYSTPNMKAVGNAMNNGASKGTGLSAAMFGGERGINDALNGATNIIGKFGAVGSALAKGLNIAKEYAGDAGINPETLMNAVEQYLGAAPNPNPSVLYEGPSLREFNFSWSFNPRNPEESRRIKKTISKLKSSSLGGTAFGTDTGVLRYPQVVMINFYPWDKGDDVSNGVYEWSDESFIRIKRCFISNISANYAPTGVPAWFEGTHDPVFIQMSLTLKEIEFFTANDWGADTKDTNFSVGN